MAADNPIRTILETNTLYLQDILDVLTESLTLARDEQERNRLAAENQAAAQIEAIRESSNAQIGESLDSTTSRLTQGGDFLRNAGLGIRNALGSLGANFLRGGPLAALGYTLGDEIGSFLGDNLSDILQDAGVQEDISNQIGKSIEDNAGSAITGAGIGRMLFKRGGIPGAVAGVLFNKLDIPNLLQSDNVQALVESTETKFNELTAGVELPNIEDFEQGATGAGLGYLAGFILRRGKVALSIAGFLADYFGIEQLADPNKRNDFMRAVEGQVEDYINALPDLSSNTGTDLNALRGATSQAAGLDLPTRDSIIPEGGFTRQQLQATPAQSGSGSLYDRLSFWQKVKGMGPLGNNALEAFDAGRSLQSGFLGSEFADPANYRTYDGNIIADLHEGLRSRIEEINDFLDLDPEIQRIFASTDSINKLTQVRDAAEALRAEVKREFVQVGNRPIDNLVQGFEEERRSAREQTTQERMRRDFPQIYDRPSVTPLNVNPINDVSGNIQGSVPTNTLSEDSKNLQGLASVTVLQPVSSTVINQDNSTNVSSSGGGGSTYIPSSSPKDYGRSLLEATV